MNKKEYFLIALVVVLVGLYVCFFTDLFAPKIIRIQHTIRPGRDAWTGGGQRATTRGRMTVNVTFALNREFKLTSIKVVPAAEYVTNDYAHPLWNLVSENGSDPTKALSYGFPIPKMSPTVSNATPDPLVPGVNYRIIIEAGSYRGEDEFSVPVRAGGRR